jgi:hypothetical protein
MPQTIQLESVDVEYTDMQLFPSDPPAVTERLAGEDELPYDLAGAEPEPIHIRVVERFGLPQRVLVAPAAEEGDGEYRVLEDPRWVTAAREAGMGKVPVRALQVRGLAAELLVLILNQARPANVAAQVDALERLMAGGTSEDELARASGMTKSRVRRLAGLLELDPVLRQALAQNRIKAQVAFAAAALDGELQAELAATFEREGQLTGAQVKQTRERAAAEDAREQAAEEGEAPSPEPADDQALARIRRQARELLRSLRDTDAPQDLQARLATVVEELERG